MELYQLRYFKAVAETEHFTRAAEKLHIAQPSLSKAISNLESELGLQLFDRDKRSVYLNSYGQSFLRHVNRILTELDDAELELQDMIGSQSGDIHIASCAIFGAPSFIHDYNSNFFFEHPSIGLHMYVANTNKIETLLCQRKIDYGLATTASEHPEIQSTLLFSYRLGLVVSRKHPLANRKAVWLSELKDDKFMCNNTSPDNRDSVYELCRRAGFEPHIIFEGESKEIIGSAISRNVGVAFISSDRFRFQQSRPKEMPWEEKNVLLNVLDDFCIRTVYLYELKERYLSSAAKIYRDGLLKSIK